MKDDKTFGNYRFETGNIVQAIISWFILLVKNIFIRTRKTITKKISNEYRMDNFYHGEEEGGWET